MQYFSTTRHSRICNVTSFRNQTFWRARCTASSSLYSKTDKYSLVRSYHYNYWYFKRQYTIQEKTTQVLPFVFSFCSDMQPPTFHKHEVSHNTLLYILNHIVFCSWRHSSGWFMKPGKCPNAGMFLKDAKATYYTLSKSFIYLVYSIFVTKCLYEINILLKIL
jgi:hypothetical protein